MDTVQENPSMDIDKRLEDMRDLTDRLADLVEAENLALADHRHEDVEETLEDKAVLARLYENMMKDLDSLALDWSMIDGGLRERLRASGERLRQAMDENTMRLEVSITANRQVIDFMAEAAKQAVPHAGTYSRKGRAGREGMNASANSVAISIDQNL